MNNITWFQINDACNESKPGVDARLGDVPDSGGLHNVPNDELPDGLQKKQELSPPFLDSEKLKHAPCPWGHTWSS